jgi:hypothetical protein
MRQIREEESVGTMIKIGETRLAKQDAILRKPGMKIFTRQVIVPV